MCLGCLLVVFGSGVFICSIQSPSAYVVPTIALLTLLSASYVNSM